jgi:hypothetical protein
MLPIDTIVRELQTAIPAGPSAPPTDGSTSGASPPGALAMPAERFEELRAQAAATCRAVRGAHVAAMQIESSPCDPRGARHIIDLLRRVRRDYPNEWHAA